jgi:hypothetical protein
MDGYFTESGPINPYLELLTRSRHHIHGPDSTVLMFREQSQMMLFNPNGNDGVYFFITHWNTLPAPKFRLGI